ncbi:protein transport protein yos1, putative [Cordyceps militaris CM01]|uniref:Protein transport protein yos1, putative n=1 Tax=Cordyceps militaris (strain CM01) TaxID=983644 RepID=G3J6H3_CORMM|nr:protein transport protein yos1, putative [Cordyceps militaris CM01]EGX96207.1 protein transport protein yos1, putative [Cordyceps militaris CM01]
MFFLGNLFYVSCLLINAVAILSEDRFLARINLSPGSHDPGFGTGSEPQSVQAKIVHLIASVRTLMRSTLAGRIQSAHGAPKRAPLTWI